MSKMTLQLKFKTNYDASKESSHGPQVYRNNYFWKFQKAVKLDSLSFVWKTGDDVTSVTFAKTVEHT